MRIIEEHKIGQELSRLISEPEPLEEDIGIVDSAGELTAVVITPQAYAFFLQKVDEEDDKLAVAAAKKFHESGEADL